MRKIAIILFFSITHYILNAQTDYRSGEYALDKIFYTNLISNLEPVYQRSPSRQSALELANAFYTIQKYEKSLMYYEIALLDAPLNEKQMSNYFNALYENGDIDLARKIAIEFNTRFQKKHFIAKLDTAESMKLFDPVYFEKSVPFNSADNEYGSITYYDNYKFINSDLSYDRTNTIKSFSPYLVDFSDTARGKRPKYIPLLTKSPNQYDVISHYDAVEDKIYITRTTLGANNQLNSKILIASVDDNFSVVNVQEFLYNSPLYSAGQACVSQDGEILYFVSDKPGGQGGADIYRCMKLEDGSWGFPINIGPNVNTSGDELYPYISPHGSTLYFSSTGHSIMGGLDINKAEKTRSHSFRKPENLGIPFNSEADDFGIVFSDDYGTEGFFSSNRKFSRGGVDIYSFSYENNKVCKDPVKNFKMIAVDKKTRARIPNVRLKMTVKLDGRVYEDISDANGEVHLLVEGCNDFDVEATHDIYLNNLFYYDGFKKTVVIELIKKELNNIIGLEKIFYEYGKFDIPVSSIPQLNKLAILLTKNTDVKIELSSHTDSRGDAEFNQKLSQKRAEQIVNHLVKSGVSPSQLVAQGYGETQIINECGNDVQCTEEQHEKNRRTEFKILEIKQ